MSGRAPVTDVQQILATDQLAHRPTRRPRTAEENRAIGELIRAMAGNEEAVLTTVTDAALRLCRAGSTGISLLEEHETEGPIFRWVALSGAYAGFVGGHTPRNFSPCGLCLGYRAPILLSYPGRIFQYFNAVEPPIVEGLVVPVSYAGEDLGTLWILSHEEARKFDGEDVRVMSNLANATAVALHLQRSKEF
jgi:GAF domain-containing protein